uniref:Envelope glycoprotein n=1 Tax=Caenorhabditis tropicalis TaxID=1561998 RepID=A0A1I7U1H3_9PELO
MKPSTSNQAVRSPLITTSPKKDLGRDNKRPSGAQTAPVGTTSGGNGGGGGGQSFLGKWQEETNQSQGSQDFARLIHTRYLSDKEKILLDALTEYKRVGYKRTLSKIILIISVCIFLLVFTVISIGCWSEHLELTEHLGVYDERYVRTRKLIIRLIRCIRLKTTTEAEARKHVDETQKDLNGLAESIIETLCEV